MPEDELKQKVDQLEQRVQKIEQRVFGPYPGQQSRPGPSGSIPPGGQPQSPEKKP